jgi:hypothetical protein
MITIIYLLVALALLYLIMKVFERSAVKARDLWRNRKHADQIIVMRPDPEDLPRRPRPHLVREARPEDTAPPPHEPDPEERS